MRTVQIGHESGSLRYMEELASGKKYDGRKDLGNTHPGDGVKYKGRGAIRIIGLKHYEDAGKKLQVDLVDNPQKAATPEVGFRVAVWFWSSHNLNSLADKPDFKAITKTINRGSNGMPDREKRYSNCKKVLNCGY